jgi:hypothetical protein
MGNDSMNSDPSLNVEEVMAEIAEEVRQRRAAGDQFGELERELQELFVAHSPASGRGGDLTEALERVDLAMFIDPVVPVGSNQKGGAALKKGMRSMLLWYIGWLTHQINQFATAASRSLHIVERRLTEVERNVAVQRVPYAGVVEFEGLSGAAVWWADRVVAAVGRAPGRILHAACSDGWLVRTLTSAGGDAYGVDPRADRIDVSQIGQGDLDLRNGAVAEHLRAVGPGALGAVVLSGVIDGMAGGERDELLGLISQALVPSGVLVIHSVTRATWQREDAPVEADLSPSQPLRGDSWRHLLEGLGYAASVETGPDEADYLVTATTPSS